MRTVFGWLVILIFLIVSLIMMLLYAWLFNDNNIFCTALLIVFPFTVLIGSIFVKEINYVWDNAGRF